MIFLLFVITAITTNLVWNDNFVVAEGSTGDIAFIAGTNSFFSSNNANSCKEKDCDDVTVVLPSPCFASIWKGKPCFPIRMLRSPQILNFQELKRERYLANTSSTNKFSENVSIASLRAVGSLAFSVFLVFSEHLFPANAIGGGFQEGGAPVISNVQTVSSNQHIQATSADYAGEKNKGLRYWDAMQSESISDIKYANEKLLDHAVGTMTTMYYDNSGGSKFSPRDLYDYWKVLRALSDGSNGGILNAVKDKDGEWKVETKNAPVIRLGSAVNLPPENAFTSRENAVKGLRWLVSTLNDPYSKYLTREELREELQSKDDGFLGLGTIVEAPQRPSSNDKAQMTPLRTAKSGPATLSITRVANLPVVTAVAPNSPAERSGIVVGDRIVAVGTDSFLGMNCEAVKKKLATQYKAENYAGNPDLTIAKPLLSPGYDDTTAIFDRPWEENASPPKRIRGYRPSRVKITTASLVPFQVYSPMLQAPVVIPDSGETVHSKAAEEATVSGGNSICYYELLTASDTIFESAPGSQHQQPVGYIRLTRFSRLSTAGFVEAVTALEKLGAGSYIIDVRNNYGGVVQEAMLTASTMLRDPNTVLCYTLNSRGGFTPHDAEEFIVDTRFPGYLLSSEPTTVTIDAVKKNNPAIFEEGWSPPSSFASLHEQGVTRGIHSSLTKSPLLQNPFKETSITNAIQKQKKLVVLVNEGTASAAEVFASSLHDAGRTVALVGAKTYGKGLIQHTFPMPDGGGLRVTVAEYLTPSLKHVTNVGGARFDQSTGELVGGGVRPDVFCASEGVPSNPGADICVGLALDLIEGTKVALPDSSSNW